MKLAVLGGSFNPIHIGHLALADEVCASLHYDRVLFIPTYSPPHKEMNTAVPASERLRMVQLACAEDSRFVADSCEIDRGGISYTYNTILHLEEKYKGELEGRIGFIMGEDLLAGFHLWNRAEDIARKCTLILARRPSLAENSSFANRPLGRYAELQSEDFDVDGDPLFEGAVKLSNAVLPVSSTDIRTRIAGGRGFRYLVPSAVFRYIIEGNVYGYK